MIENENESLRERVSDLEKKMLEQTDEIVCLRSTVADVLRRLQQIEGFRGISLSAGTPIHVSNHQGHTVKDGTTVRHRSTADSGRRRISSYIPSTPSYRRSTGSHYQSTSSLHSVDSYGSNGVFAASSGSPAPSPSPTRSSPSPRQQPATPSMVRSPSGSSLNRRWGSAGDFDSAVSTVAPQNRRLATKSLLNLHVRPNQLNHVQKHGTKDATYDSADGCIRMWLRGRAVPLYLPSELYSENEEVGYTLSRVLPAPTQRLQLEWVYGYRGRDCRANLHLLPTGEMVYFVAAVVVLFDAEEHTQRHYLGHTDDVKCLALHPNKLLIATGQTAGHGMDAKPHIRVWNTVSLSTLHVIGMGEFERSVCCVSFSKADGGIFLCAVDEAVDHIISVWDWQKGNRIAETKSSADTVTAAEFHPMDKHSVVTCGKSHVHFWTLEGGGVLSKRLGLFEGRDKPKYVTCIAFTGEGHILTGDSEGNILIWLRGSNSVAKAIRGAHDGPTFSLCVLPDGSFVSGGGRDGRLVHWSPLPVEDNETNSVPTFELSSETTMSQGGGIRTIARGRGSELLVGTTRNCILAGSLELPFHMLVSGHSDELWGLAIHPDRSQFVTVGNDGLVCMWDTLARTLVWSQDLGDACLSATISPNGTTIVIGTATGRWVSLDSETRQVEDAHMAGSEPISVVRFSPDGTHLAVGSRDNNIYVYRSDGRKKFERVGRCTGHSSYITHLDWSSDGTHLQTNSGDYELLYWNGQLCRQIPQSSRLRDVEWATQTCTLGYSTFGIWPEGADGTDVNACDRSNSKALLASGDDFGRVKLFTCPALQPKSLSHSYGGHSSHVTNVAFLHDDSRLLSTGGKDTSAMQWVVIA